MKACWQPTGEKSVMNILTRAILRGCLVLAVSVIANSIQADPPVIFPLCDPAPIPIDPVGPTAQLEYSIGGENFTLDAWRYPCAVNYSYVVFTVRPFGDATPSICSQDLTLVQSDQKSTDYVLKQEPFGEEGGFCGDVVADTSFILWPSSLDDQTINLQREFEVLWDLGAGTGQFTLFAYNPDDYDDEDFPPGDGLVNDAGLNGLYYDPVNPGHGFEVNVYEAGLIVYYFGQTANGGQLWLISELFEGDIDFDSVVQLPMFTVSGTFGQPVMPADEWGSLSIRFNSCDSATAIMDGLDGAFQVELVKMTGLEGVSCK